LVFLFASSKLLRLEDNLDFSPVELFTSFLLVISDHPSDLHFDMV